MSKMSGEVHSGLSVELYLEIELEMASLSMTLTRESTKVATAMSAPRFAYQYFGPNATYLSVRARCRRVKHIVLPVRI